MRQEVIALGFAEHFVPASEVAHALPGCTTRTEVGTHSWTALLQASFAVCSRAAMSSVAGSADSIS